MKNKEVMFKFITLALFIGFCFYGLNVYSDIRKAEIQNSIKKTCGELYRYTETLSNGAITSYPMEKEYKDCVQSK